jgi:hypothetical protein
MPHFKKSQTPWEFPSCVCGTTAKNIKSPEKKITLYRERDEKKRQDYIQELALIDPAQVVFVIASVAWQSVENRKWLTDCFVSLAMTVFFDFCGAFYRNKKGRLCDKIVTIVTNA